jgi:hypothetical protein
MPDWARSPISSVKNFETEALLTFLVVIREIDIWRIAVLMVNRYADAAEAKADRCADELRPKGESRRSAPKLETEGDHAGAAIWRRVTVSIDLPTDTTGPPVCHELF